MKISQSRKQSAVYRLQQFIIYALISFMLAVVLIYMGVLDYPIDLTYIYAYGALQVLIFAWLLVFNRSDYKVEEHAFEIDEENITYYEMADKTQISIREIVKYKVAGVISSSVKIYSAKGRVLSIDLNLFSKAQRAQLLSKLKSIFPGNVA